MDNMEDLFTKLKESEQYTKALLVGRNLVNKDPGNDENVNKYMELLLSLAEKLPSYDERKSFLGQASVTISFYEENTDLDEEKIQKIFDYKTKIDALAKELSDIERKSNDDYVQRIRDKNEELIKSLYVEKQNITSASNTNDFNKILNTISEIDAQIEHDFLTKEQESHYAQLNKGCTEEISNKMRELEYKENKKYNMEAVKAFEEAFKKFRDDESKYKNQTQLYSLVSQTLFAYDAGRLFNETLIYYNHVYSYIFGKMNDDGKLALTRFSIECERRLR